MKRTKQLINSHQRRVQRRNRQFPSMRIVCNPFLIEIERMATIPICAVTIIHSCIFLVTHDDIAIKSKLP